MSAQQKQLRIQTGVVSRTFKEKVIWLNDEFLWFFNFVRIGTRGLRVYDDEKVLDAKYGFHLILVKEFWEKYTKNGPNLAKNGPYWAKNVYRPDDQRIRDCQMIRRWSDFKIYYEKELGQFEAKLKNTNYANEEEEYRAKMIPQQIDETKAALKDTEDRLSNGKRF